jgi:hypothetical protein
MGWGSWLAIVLVTFIILTMVGLAIYGGRTQPPVHHIEQVVPDASLPH